MAEPLRLEVVGAGGGPGGPTITIAAQALRVAEESDLAA